VVNLASLRTAQCLLTDWRAVYSPEHGSVRVGPALPSSPAIPALSAPAARACPSSRAAATPQVAARRAYGDADAQGSVAFRQLEK
jgi:hypothetical protein